MHKKYYIELAFAIVLIVSLTNPIYAATDIPENPIQVYGNIIQSGNPIPDGILISFYKDSELLTSSTTKDGKYGFEKETYINGDFISLGDTITIKINGKTVYDINYLGGSDIGIDLNLAPDLSINPPSKEEIDSLNSNDCTPNWQCSGWSSCINNLQTRTCQDSNRCQTEKDKPEEQKECGESITNPVVVGTPFIKDEPTKQNTTEDSNLSLYLIYFAISVTLGVLFFLIIKESGKHKHVPKDEPHRFIHLSLKEGHPEHHIKKQLKEKGWHHKHVEDAMQKEKLRHYIIDQLKQGVNKTELRDYLIKYGWDKDLVEELIK